MSHKTTLTHITATLAIALMAFFVMTSTGCNTIRGAGDAAAASAQSITHGIADDAEAVEQEMKD